MTLIHKIVEPLCGRRPGRPSAIPRIVTSLFTFLSICTKSSMGRACGIIDHCRLMPPAPCVLENPGNTGKPGKCGVPRPRMSWNTREIRENPGKCGVPRPRVRAHRLRVRAHRPRVRTVRAHKPGPTGAESGPTGAESGPI